MSPYADGGGYDLVPRTGWTNSSKSKQYVDDKEEDTTDNTLFGHVMYAVNTVRDLAYVGSIVGWNRIWWLSIGMDLRHPRG